MGIFHLISLRFMNCKTIARANGYKSSGESRSLGIHPSFWGFREASIRLIQASGARPATNFARALEIGKIFH